MVPFLKCYTSNTQLSSSACTNIFDSSKGPDSNRHIMNSALYLAAKHVKTVKLNQDKVGKLSFYHKIWLF